MKRQRGAALMVLLMVAGALAAYFLVRAFNSVNTERGKVISASLAQAKDALIGFAATYRDTHPTEVPGQLLLPDLGSTRNTTPGEGNPAGNFTGNVTNNSVVGRLPWRRLGLPALRDASGECLWYAVSGAYQDALKSRFVNWDTLGQFDTFSSDGTPAGTASTVGTNFPLRPAAIIFAPGPVLAGQGRAPMGVDTVTECRGNYDARNYLDTFNPNPSLNNIVNYLAGVNNATGTFSFSVPKQVVAGPVLGTTGNELVNDRMLTITPDELFRAIRRRNDFGGFVDNRLLAVVAANLPMLAASANRAATIDFTPVAPTEALGGTMVGSLEIGRVPRVALTSTPLEKWQDNLLYARCASGASCLTVVDLTNPPATLSCTGVVVFPGERGIGQVRATNAQRNTWNNYLEGAVLTAFTAGLTTFSGPTAYSAGATSLDVLACVAPTPPGSKQVSFASDFGGLVVVGPGVALNAAAQTVSIGPAGGSSGGCVWSPTALGLATKVLRAYYEFTLTTADTFALTGTAPDHGYGFTISLVRGDNLASPPTIPATFVPPNTCGTESRMGTLGAADVWGGDSIIVETDVRRNGPALDPVENHTAIMLNGNIDHTGPGDTMSAACNATAAGCRHAPANNFEEAPPQIHNQRIEIHTGCNAACTVCNPPAHAPPNDFARITAWVDCVDCENVALDLNRVTRVPTIQRCVALAPSLTNPFIGFTGGFLGGASQQGVTLKNFVVRSQ